MATSPSNVIERCMEKGVLMFSPVGFGGGTVKIAPPLVITEEAILESVGRAGRGFRRSRGRQSGGSLMPASQVLIVGGGMITHDQILPSLYQLQRKGRVGEITVCALNGRAWRALAGCRGLASAPFPASLSTAIRRAPISDRAQPDLYRELIARLPPRQIVVVAVPDQLHFDVIMTALRHDQHVCTVKPLVLSHAQAQEIEREAYARGLVVGIEYHKRFDDRSLMARRNYREGLFGEFRLGTACLLEKWYYRHSNFQNWMTTENSDAFTYIGCHYVDLVALHHRPAARYRSACTASPTSIPTARKVFSGPMRASSGSTARASTCRTRSAFPMPRRAPIRRA